MLSNESPLTYIILDAVARAYNLAVKELSRPSTEGNKIHVLIRTDAEEALASLLQLDLEPEFVTPASHQAIEHLTKQTANVH